MLIVLIVLVTKKPIKAPKITVCDALVVVQDDACQQTGREKVCLKIVLAARGPMRLKTSGIRRFNDDIQNMMCLFILYY